MQKSHILLSNWDYNCLRLLLNYLFSTVDFPGYQKISGHFE